MKPVGFVGRLAAGQLVDRQLVDWYIPGKWVRAILFDAFEGNCMAVAANDA